MPAATKAAQNGAAATDAALTQFTESVAAAFSETSTVAGDMNAALGSAVLPVPDVGTGPPPGLLAALRSAIGDEGVVVDPSVTAAYSRDMMPLAPWVIGWWPRYPIPTVRYKSSRCRPSGGSPMPARCRDYCRCCMTRMIACALG